MNSKVYEKALKHFKKVDPSFHKQVRKIKLEPIPSKKISADAYLARSIISQQISVKAAASIYKRFLELFPDGQLCHAHLLTLTDEQLRGAGLSTGKTKYIRDLSEKFIRGELPSQPQLKKMKDDEIVEAYVKVKGIGIWTVQMLLIFFLRRQDVMPSGDLGVQRGFQIAFNKRSLPSHNVLLKRAKLWEPYRSVAALYLWHIKDSL